MNPLRIALIASLGFISHLTAQPTRAPNAPSLPSSAQPLPNQNGTTPPIQVIRPASPAGISLLALPTNEQGLIGTMQLAVSAEEQIKRLNARITMLQHLILIMQRDQAALNQSLATLSARAAPPMCVGLDSRTGGYVHTSTDVNFQLDYSQNVLGAVQKCVPYKCNNVTGLCIRPPAVSTEECSLGFLMDSGNCIPPVSGN